MHTNAAVDALGLVDVEQFAQVPRLLVLVPDVVAVQPHGLAALVFEDLVAARPVIGCAAIGRAAELGDGNRLGLIDQRMDGPLVHVGDRLRAVRVDRDDVERRPVDPLQPDRRVCDRAAEPLSQVGRERPPGHPVEAEAAVVTDTTSPHTPLQRWLRSVPYSAKERSAVAIVLLRNEFITRGFPTIPDEVLTESIDMVFLPLVRHAG